jgi:uncharacterized protein YjbJ (UPF0337 family)
MYRPLVSRLQFKSLAGGNAGHRKGEPMNWDQVEGKWKQMRGSVKQKWAKLTDSDLDYISGSRDQFIGRLQERYGIAREEAQKQADEWLKTAADSGTERPETRHSGSGA